MAFKGSHWFLSPNRYTVLQHLEKAWYIRIANIFDFEVNIFLVWICYFRASHIKSVFIIYILRNTHQKAIS